MGIEDKYEEVRHLINIGREKGYLVYDEVNDILPEEVSSPEEIDDIFLLFDQLGIEVVDSESAFKRKDEKIEKEAEPEGEFPFRRRPSIPSCIRRSRWKAFPTSRRKPSPATYPGFRRLSRPFTRAGQMDPKSASSGPRPRTTPRSSNRGPTRSQAKCPGLLSNRRPS